MKQSTPFSILTMLFLATMLTGCELVAGIFKTGMGVGAFVVIAIIMVAVFFVIRSKGSKS